MKDTKANNKYLKDFNPTKPENYLLYVDGNNIYGWALSQKSPYKDIMWTDPNNRILEELKEEILELSEDENSGYIIDCGLESLKELHNEHKDLLLAPEH